MTPTVRGNWVTVSEREHARRERGERRDHTGGADSRFAVALLTLIRRKRDAGSDPFPSPPLGEREGDALPRRAPRTEARRPAESHGRAHGASAGPRPSPPYS